ncbi:MAG: hypothetical protein QM734_15340 [Cyclobacteriaceae bacterium]
MKAFFLLLLAIAIHGQVSSQIKIDLEKLGQNPGVGKYADVRGFKMYYEIYGTGEPLLLFMAMVGR